MVQSAAARRPVLNDVLRKLLRVPFGEPARLVGLAILVGIVGGFGAIIFRKMIGLVYSFFHGFLLGPGLHWPHGWHGDLLIASPALGLLAVGVITTRFAREVKGHGVPQILEALALRGGRIRPRVGFFGILAPAITIGAGGSVGREGPIALIGAAFGSTLGQLLRLSDQQMSLLVACGAAAGIGATFNAPIAGALFGLEVVLGSYAMGALVPCFVASVTAVTIFDWIEGSAALLPTPSYAFVHPFGVIFGLVLGLFAGGVALAYTRGLNFVEGLTEKVKVGFVGKAIVGGLTIGLIGRFLPDILGVGYQTMQNATLGKFALLTLLLLLVGKYVATLLTIGSGGSGGVFAPSLFLGVMFGAVFGVVVHHLFPGFTSPPVVYAVAGMGAVFAGSAQAPLTAATIILEMTGDYRLVTGVMAACAISYLVHGVLARDSMYTVRLSHRGIQILRGTEVRPLGQVAVGAAMERRPLSLSAGEDVQHAYHELTVSGQEGALVVDDQGQLLGVLESKQVYNAVNSGEEVNVGDLARKDVPVLTPDASLDDAMRRFGIFSTSIIPVVSERGSRSVLGAVTQQATLQAYYRHTVLTMEMERRMDLIAKRQPARNEGTFREVMLPANWNNAAHVADVGRTLPRGTVLVSVTRGDDELVARGETELHGGDRVLLYATREGDLDRAADLLVSGEIVIESGGMFHEVQIPAASAQTPRRVSDLHLPKGVVLVSVRRGNQTLVPSGGTELQPGDVVTLYATDGKSISDAEGRLRTEGAIAHP